MLYSEYARMVIQEFQTVALLNQIATAIIGKCNTILYSSASVGFTPTFIIEPNLLDGSRRHSASGTANIVPVHASREQSCHICSGTVGRKEPKQKTTRLGGYWVVFVLRLQEKITTLYFNEASAYADMMHSLRSYDVATSSP